MENLEELLARVLDRHRDASDGLRNMRTLIRRGLILFQAELSWRQKQKAFTNRIGPSMP